jgi:hypothetical protein
VGVEVLVVVVDGEERRGFGIKEPQKLGCRTRGTERWRACVDEEGARRAKCRVCVVVRGREGAAMRIVVGARTRARKRGVGSIFVWHACVCVWFSFVVGVD